MNELFSRRSAVLCKNQSRLLFPLDSGPEEIFSVESCERARESRVMSVWHSKQNFSSMMVCEVSHQYWSSVSVMTTRRRWRYMSRSDVPAAGNTTLKIMTACVLATSTGPLDEEWQKTLKNTIVVTSSWRRVQPRNKTSTQTCLLQKHMCGFKIKRQ